MWGVGMRGEDVRNGGKVGEGAWGEYIVRGG